LTAIAKAPTSKTSPAKRGSASLCKISAQRAAKLSKKALARLKRAEKARCDTKAKGNGKGKGKGAAKRGKGHKSGRLGIHGTGSGGAQRGGSKKTAPTTALASGGFTWNAGVEVLNAPLTAAELSAISYVGTAENQPPRFLIPIYKAAARRYHLPWQILAAINAIETDYGRDLAVSSAGAMGFMQFMPSTWQEWGISAKGQGAPNPYDPADAIFSAARYLHATGAPHYLRRALFAYNHATWYVDEVVWTAQSIMDRGRAGNRKARAKIGAMRTLAEILNGEPYIWGAGHGGWGIDVGYDCSGFVSAVLHAAGYLTTPVTTQTLASQPGIVPGPGRYVTMFDRTDAASTTEDHVIIDINGQWWESGGSEADGNGGVHRMRGVTSSYLATFNRILHPEGM
jgi:cell wall-associated NlpC family hydrolase